jgi:hypothetical protein
MLTMPLRIKAFFACETGRHIAAIYNSLIHRIVDVIYDRFGVMVNFLLLCCVFGRLVSQQDKWIDAAFQSVRL